MNDTTSVSYHLRRFKSSDDPDFVEALDIYSRNTELQIRTNTNEMIYWLDNFEINHKDSFYIFGFYLNNKLIGFSEMAFFIEEKILIIDYLIIDTPYRGNNTFYEFINQLRMFFKTFDVAHFVTEVVYNSDGKEPSEQSKNLIRLLKISHFKVIKAPYFQPRLGTNNYESEMKAVLMLYCQNEKDSIKIETFNTIVETIYVKYYLRWYNVFLAEKDKYNYSRTISILLKKIASEIPDKKTIELNGHHHLSKDEPETIKPVKTFTAITLTLIMFILIISSSITFHLILKDKLKIESSVQGYILIISLISCVGLLAFLYRGQNKLFRTFFYKILDRLFK